MKIKDLFEIVENLPEADIVVELIDKQRFYASGIWLRQDKDNNPIVVIKASKKISK